MSGIGENHGLPPLDRALERDEGETPDTPCPARPSGVKQELERRNVAATALASSLPSKLMSCRSHLGLHLFQGSGYLHLDIP